MDMRGGYCLVLSGGGAKGVYHIGAWRALRELGVPVVGFIGNSIGAIIAGFLAQGLDAELEEIGAGMGIYSVLKLPEDLVEDGDLKLDFDALPRLRELTRDFLSSKGLDTSPLRALVEAHIDEDKIRASGVDLGIVTVNMSDLAPREVFIEAMEPGSLPDYLMASAALPGFVQPVIKGKKYVDGGLYDNLPYAVARRRGYRHIIVVDISGVGINRRPEIAGSETIYIKNSIDMGGPLDFNRGFMDRFTLLGYLDTMRVFGRLEGYSYFIMPDDRAERSFRDMLASRDDGRARALLEPSSSLFPARMRHDRRLLLKMLECAAITLDIERVRAYTYEELARAIAERIEVENARAGAIIASPESAPAGAQGAKGGPKKLASIVLSAVRQARLTDCPYFYVRIARAPAVRKTGPLPEKALAALVPELEAGMAWIDMALRVPETESAAAMPATASDLRAAGLVRLADTVPGILVDMRYATEGNFFGRKLYDSAGAWLLEGSARKLEAAERAACESGLRLVVLDAYRPLSVQALMWRIMPDEDFVAPMSRGSVHNRGAAVDVTLADSEGRLLPMPSDFDEFSERASHDYAGGDPAELTNRDKLRAIMEGAGFASYVNEWWHYVDPELRGSPLLDIYA